MAARPESARWAVSIHGDSVLPTRRIASPYTTNRVSLHGESRLPTWRVWVSYTANGITIRHSDDAGAFYAKITLFHSGRWDSKAKCKVYPCLEIRDWPQFRWRGVHLDDSHCYFDARQGLAEDPHHYFGSAVTTLKKVYQFDPYEGVEPAARKNVVGGQCCNWSTHTFCLEGLEWKMWPRGFALAEVLWTYPDPAKRDFKEFEARAANYRHRLIGAHVNCAPLK